MPSPLPPAPPTDASPDGLAVDDGSDGGIAFDGSPAALLAGLAQLGTEGFEGVVGVVQDMHGAIARDARLGIEWPAALSIAPVVYRGVRSTGRLVGRAVQALARHVPARADATADGTGTRTAALVAALNGVWGDHLAHTCNPLALPMTLRRRPPADGQPEHPPSGRIAVLVHGLGMNDRQWSRDGHDHGEALARDAGFTPVYARYNSGLHVSDNGRRLSARLQALVDRWPVPVRELVLIGHSMGGLVLRSACHLGRGQPWQQRLGALVCLGTPHHGAPLERAGALADGLLRAHRYVLPLSRLGRARSAGITDLRHGNVQDADWQHIGARDRARTRSRDHRVPTPLPEGVPCFLVAALLRPSGRSAVARQLGDGLVPLPSALGDHRNPTLRLQVPAHHRLVITSANHFDLLSSAQVYAHLREWLG